MNTAAASVDWIRSAQANAERDRRATKTAALLAAGAHSVVRLSARMPAAMRELGLSDEPVDRGARMFESACRDRSLDLLEAGVGSGPLGPWRLWTSDSASIELKRAALYLEEGSWLGQLLDIDVMDSDGPEGRADLCLPPRPCAVCGAPAAACSGRGIHDSAAVYAAFAAILERSRTGALVPDMHEDLRMGAPLASVHP